MSIHLIKQYHEMKCRLLILFVTLIHLANAQHMPHKIINMTDDLIKNIQFCIDTFDFQDDTDTYHVIEQINESVLVIIQLELEYINEFLKNDDMTKYIIYNGHLSDKSYKHINYVFSTDAKRYNSVKKTIRTIITDYIHSYTILRNNIKFPHELINILSLQIDFLTEFRDTIKEKN